MKSLPKASPLEDLVQFLILLLLIPTVVIVVLLNPTFRSSRSPLLRVPTPDGVVLLRARAVPLPRHRPRGWLPLPRLCCADDRGYSGI